MTVCFSYLFFLSKIADLVYTDKYLDFTYFSFFPFGDFDFGSESESREFYYCICDFNGSNDLCLARSIISNYFYFSASPEIISATLLLTLEYR